MIGAPHDWNSKLSSNFTFAESHFRNTSGQPATDINDLTYLEANVIWTPLERCEVGVQYSYRKREDISGQSGLASRIQIIRHAGVERIDKEGRSWLGHETSPC